MKSTEKETQKACIELLNAKGFFCWRNNTGAFQGQGGGFYRFGFKGSPDIIAILPPTGHFLGIECKDIKEDLNENQDHFKNLTEKMGGSYIVAKSIDDLILFLKEWKP